MTIQQALERAKQLGKERSLPKPAGRPDTHSVALEPARQSMKANRIPKVVPQIEFPRIFPNLLTCASSRVLLNTEPSSTTGSAYDAYRIIRTKLRQKSAANGWQRFAVTSAGAGEGKTTTAVNLALALAREKQGNVFLLDLDLRNPSIVENLGIVPPAEIGRFLAGEGAAADLFFSIGIEHLAIAAGTLRFDNSSELLSTPRLEELLGFISAQDPNAWVVVDLPPLLATADALIIAPKVSSIVVVVSEGKTRREDLQRATEMLSGSEIAGVILNRSKQAGNSYYGYY